VVSQYQEYKAGRGTAYHQQQVSFLASIKLFLIKNLWIFCFVSSLWPENPIQGDKRNNECLEIKFFSLIATQKN
jgi:hypothetical protein